MSEGLARSSQYSQGLKDTQRTETMRWSKDRNDLFEEVLRDTDLGQSEENALEHCYQPAGPMRRGLLTDENAVRDGPEGPARLVGDRGERDVVALDFLVRVPL